MFSDWQGWLLAIGFIGLGVVQLGQRAASSWWVTTNRQQPFGLTEQLLERGKFLNTMSAVRSLGEDALGGRRFVVPHHEEPTQYILTQRTQKKPSISKPARSLKTEF